eukprot:7073976-Ditylum_brightwellii.AAC.2
MAIDESPNKSPKDCKSSAVNDTYLSHVWKQPSMIQMVSMSVLYSESINYIQNGNTEEGRA